MDFNHRLSRESSHASHASPTPTLPLPDTNTPKTSADTERAQLTKDARAATKKEAEMTLWQGIKTYPKAVAWSILISTCIVMEGYDISLLSNFYAFPQFNQKFGDLQPDGTYSLTASWQAGLSNAVNVGEIIGLFLNGYLSERFGYRMTLLGSLIALTAFIAIPFTANNLTQVLIGELLMGLPWGVFQVGTISYAVEVCPVVLRSYLACYINLCWGVGQLLGIAVIRSMLSRMDEWSFRIPWAIQWMWPVPLIVGVWLAPESPWWLVRKGQSTKARHSLLRLTSPHRDSSFDVNETVAMMRHTTLLEERLTNGAGWMDCFRGVDLRRTEIVCMVWAIQNLCGNSFTSYSSYFFLQAGLSSSNSYNFSLAQYAINTLGVFAAWFLMSRGIGRRSLYLYGLCFLCLVLVVIGFLGLLGDRKTERGYATGALLLVWAAGYQATVGTVAYSLVGEMSSRRLTVKTVVLGRNAYNVIGIVCSTITPYMLNPTAWNWQNYTAFFWAGLAFMCIIYTYYRIPEPQGRSFAEMDLLFERGVSARDFARTRVDVFEGEEGEKEEAGQVGKGEKV